MQRIISITNQKGGVGKTTTAQNLGAGLHRLGRKVLLIDFDPQGNLTDAMGYAPSELEQMVANFCEGENFLDVVLNYDDGLDLLPSNLYFSRREIAWVQKMSREGILKRSLDRSHEYIKDYDYILLDLPPSLGLFTMNCLTASNEVIIPVQAEYHAMSGFDLIIESIELIQQNTNPNIELSMVIPTMYNRTKRLNREVTKALRENLADKLSEVAIRENIALAEAPSYGQDIFSYAPKSNGAIDYLALSKYVDSKTK